MSKVALTGNASGTGTLTVAAPNTNSDYTLTLPQSTGTMATEAYADAVTPAALSTASGSAPSYSARAWVQYLGYDGTVNGSGNVSSVTDNGTGDFTVNFTSAMPDTNYSWAIGYSSNPGSAQRNRGFFELETISTGSSRIYQTDNAGSAWDMTITTFQVFR